MSERDYICGRLADLASLASQRRYIIHGTKDEYLLPEELLENAYDCVRRVRTVPAAMEALPEAVVDAILQLEPLLVAIPESLPSLTHLIEDDPAWHAVREQAARCLDLMNFDLRGWEITEGLNTG